MRVEADMELWRLSSEEWTALGLSLRVAAVATLAGLPVSIAIG
jgi:ABC-type molybdate transport system permease subunit